MATAARLGAAALVLALTGCVAVPPPGPTADEVEAYQVLILERSWRNTGLPGEAPLVDAAAPVSTQDSFEPLSACFEEQGVAVRGWGYGPEGYTLDMVEGGEPTASEQLGFYICVASNPFQVSPADVLSPAQLDYIYDYYRSWLVPCLLHHHYGVARVLSREEYIDLGGQWDPYFEAGIATSAEYDRAVELCGPFRPALD